jgi:FAD-dependent urate hydroxylase
VKALVIGGGIGGLAAAVALRRAGHEVAVFEQAGRFGAVGAGLAVSGNGVAALGTLALREEAVAGGALAARVRLRASNGTRLADFRLDPGQESLGIHRAVLLEVLRRAAGEDVYLGKRCTSVSQSASGVTARFADGSELRGDFLIGADGINSVTRTCLFDSDQRRYAGYAGWRAVAEVTPALRSPGAFWETWGRGTRFGCVDISGGRVYWFVSQSQAEDASAPREGSKASFLRRFSEWHEPIVSLIEATPEDALSRTLIYDRRPSNRWGDRRITLLGDAAHAMTPNLGQGASQALEDAAVLGRVAREYADANNMLRAYERRRIRRANMIVRWSRQSGRLAQAHNPIVSALRDRLLRATPASMQKAQQQKLLEFEL